MKNSVKIMLSNHHVHITEETLAVLFGKEYTLTPRKDLGMDQFACEECVTVRGPKGSLSGFRIIGPCRSADQVELLCSDIRALGVDPPVAESGHLEEAVDLTMEGPEGSVSSKCGIIAARHVHLSETRAAELGISDREKVAVTSTGPRRTTFHDVIVRVHLGEGFDVVHLDFEEGNASGFRNGDEAELIREDTLHS